jgi:hypothetical protein
VLAALILGAILLFLRKRKNAQNTSTIPPYGPGSDFYAGKSGRDSLDYGGFSTQAGYHKPGGGQTIELDSMPAGSHSSGPVELAVPGTAGYKGPVKHDRMSYSSTEALTPAHANQTYELHSDTVSLRHLSGGSDTSYEPYRQQ